MILTENRAQLELQSEAPVIDNVFRHIERCGRTCYKSLEDMAENSSDRFVEKMINSEHLSVLEHGTIYLTVPFSLWNIVKWFKIKHKYSRNPYSKCVVGYQQNSLGPSWLKIKTLFITTNYRVLIENNWLDDLVYFTSPNPKYHEKRLTFRFFSDIQVSKEATRHRVLSPSVESTRFCNYTKNKFDNSIRFSIPVWLKSEEEDEFIEDCRVMENLYFKWINKGWSPQQAAYFLCQGTASEFVLTGFESDWKDFIDKRFVGVTGSPHLSMKEVAVYVANEVYKKATHTKE